MAKSAEETAGATRFVVSPPGGRPGLNMKGNTMAEVGGVAVDHLKAFIDRIERLEEEKAALMEDIKDVYSEAKGTGFDVKAMRQIIRLRKMDESDRQEQAHILELYAKAVGVEGLPLFAG